MGFDVFISHATEDASVARLVCREIEASGIAAWLAARDIAPGENYATALSTALEASRVLVLIVSPRANDSPHVLREVERAVSRGIPVLPLRIETTRLSHALAYLLNAVQWLDAVSPDRTAAIAALIARLKQLLGEPDGAGPLRSEGMLLRWYPPARGESVTLVIEDDVRQALRCGWEGKASAQERQHIVNTQMFSVTCSQSRPAASLTLNLLPTSHESTAESEAGERLSVRAWRQGDKIRTSSQSADQRAGQGLERILESRMRGPIEFEISPRGMPIASAGQSVGISFGGTDGATKLFETLAFIGGNDATEMTAEKLLLPFPDEPVTQGTRWQFSRQQISMGCQILGRCEASVETAERLTDEQLVQVRERTVIEIDTAGLGRALAQGLQGQFPTARITPLAGHLTYATADGLWIFDASRGCPRLHQYFTTVTHQARLLVESAEGRRVWTVEGTTTTGTKVRWYRH